MNAAYRVKEWEKVLLKNCFLWGPSLSDRMSVAKRSYVSCALLIQWARQGLYRSSNDLQERSPTLSRLHSVRRVVTGLTTIRGNGLDALFPVFRGFEGVI